MCGMQVGGFDVEGKGGWRFIVVQILGLTTLFLPVRVAHGDF